MFDPESYPSAILEINRLLEEIHSGAKAILGSQFVGMYLYGSLAHGGFDARKSDIDFLVVTEERLTENLFSDLLTFHAEVTETGSKWTNHLEGSYIPLKALRRFDPTDSLHPHIEKGGPLTLMQHDSAWLIQLHVLREWGTIVEGPPPINLIDPISTAELRQATLNILNDWWLPMLQDPHLLVQPDYRVYAVLTMARILYTLKRGQVVAKPWAATWALSKFSEKWRPLLESALKWSNGEPYDYLDETLDWIRFTSEYGQKLSHPSSGA